MIKVLGIIPLLTVMGGGTAQAFDINAYAVSNFRPCGSSNLPATIAEMERFFASENFPEDARKNFLWTDSAVQQADWAEATDAVESTETANGLAGADSSLLSYIASHGVTSNGVYSAIAGTSSNGGCYMSSSDMYLGDQFARYAILSTCQGLKIGSGSNPSRPGEDPSDTWRDAAPGMNCIFGYSNNMADASGYGEYLLDLLALGEDTLAEAFFKASRQVSYGNIPATMCFGADEDQARYHLENMMAFTSDRVGGDVSVWAYRDARRLEGAFVVAAGQSVAGQVSMVIPHAAMQRVATKGALKVNAEQGILTFAAKTTAPTKVMNMSDATVIKIAKTFLKDQGLDVASWNLVPSYVIDKGTKVDGEKVVTEKMVVMHQSVGGMALLGTAGSFEVNVDANGTVTQATLAPRILAQNTALEAKTIDSATIVSAKAQALDNLVARYPSATLTTQNVRIGFDSHTYLEPKAQAAAVVEVEVEVEEGGVARVFIERLAI